MKLGTEIKAIWIASVARCGSMWTFNITRQVVRAAGLEVLPSLVPQTDEAMWAAFQEGVQDLATDRVRVLKTHDVLRPDLPASRFILPRRDIRDTVVSFMRFMRCDFETAIKFARSALEYQRHYDEWPRDRALIIDYQDIVARPIDVVHTISAFLEVPVDRKAMNAILCDLSKEKVALLIERKEQDIIRRAREGGPITADEVVVLGPKNIRAFDTATGFQSGHVSNYREGDWKRILTVEQRSRLEVLVGTFSHPSSALSLNNFVGVRAEPSTGQPIWR